MSTTAVSSPSIYQELQTFYQTRQSDLKQLGNALQSGSLSGAEQAYQSLAALGADGPFANSEPFSKSSRDQDFNTIGEALQAGDLVQAQTAFAALTGHQSSSQATPATVVNLTSTQPGTTAAGTAPSTDASSIYDQLRAYQQQRTADLNQLGQDLQAGNLSAAQQDFNTLTALGQSGPNENGQPFQRTDRAQDFQAIGQALQSGNLSGAQSAFANLAATFGQGSPSAPVSVGPAPVVPPVTPPPVVLPPVVGGPVPIVPPVVLPPVVGGPVPIVPPIVSPTAPPAVQVPHTNPPASVGSPIGRLPPSTVILPPSGAPSTGSGVSEIVINLSEGSGSSSTSPEEITIHLDAGAAGEQLSIDTTQGQNGDSNQQFTINLNAQDNYEVILNLLNSSSTSPTQNGATNALSVQA